MSINKKDTKNNIIILVVLIVTILVCTLPMKLSPYWNGQFLDYHHQYELLAESFLNGHLYLDYNDIDEKLLAMDNPYDAKERKKLGISVHWDHAFYKGKYYVYFGVAPTILVFLPYRIIIGHALSTYHATQLFTTLFIIGLFLLLYTIRKYFYKESKFSNYLLLSVALSVLSILGCITHPELYCTAISSGLCMAIWSIYFYIRAIYGDNSLNKAIFLAAIGGLFGALTFACRPPIGLINIVEIPLLIIFFKKYGLNKKTIMKVLIVLIPYIIIGASLMIYNYVRFDNVLEFGQSYQLTVADQHDYLNILSKFNYKTIKSILENFFKLPKYYNYFPYVNTSSIFFNFPILLLPYILILDKKYRKNLKDKKLMLLYISLMILPFIITTLDALSTPYLIERYRMDEYYILAILTFISISNYYTIHKSKKDWLKIIINILAIITIIKCILLFFIPFDNNITDYNKI